MASSSREWVRLEVVDRWSLMSKRKRVDASAEPWGTSAFTGNGWNRTSSTRMQIFRLLRKLDLHETRGRKNPNVGSFDRRPCQTQSEALAMSSENRCVSLWLRVKLIKSVGRGPACQPLKGEIGILIGGRSVVLHARETTAVGWRWQFEILPK